MSEIATAFKPPKTAYIAPIVPMAITVIRNPCALEILKFSEILNILSILIAPVYKTMGRSVTTNDTIKNNATIVLVVLSNLDSKN